VLILTIAAVLFVVHLGLALATHRGRRLLRAKWHRRLDWQCWPDWLLQLPLVPYILFLAAKHRTLTLSKTVSKTELLAELPAGLAVRSLLIPERLPLEEKRARLADFATSNPIMLKPDTGRNGEGLAGVRDEGQAASYLEHCPHDVLAQDFVPGEELSLTYNGGIRTITRKAPAIVTGDGERTLEFLILDDPQAVFHAERFCADHSARLDEVPARDETVTLSRFGTRRGGCHFIDVSHLPLELGDLPPGRYDLRHDGERYRIIERDAPGTPPTHLYDPEFTYLQALRALRDHWRTTFETAPKHRNLILLIRRLYQRLTHQPWQPEQR